MEDYEWKVPLPAGSEIFRAIRIYYKDGTECIIEPKEGQHVLLMTWQEIERTQSQVPGMVLYHSDTVIVSRMIDRLLRKYPDIWYNIQKEWAMREFQEQFKKRLIAKFGDRTNKVN